MDNILTALITGGLALIGVIITNATSNRAIENSLKIAQAVTDTKIESLTEEVRKHNDFALKIPVIEQRLSQLEREMHEVRCEKN